MSNQKYVSDNLIKDGGVNEVVEIDEAKFGRIKHNHGRLIEGQQILGGIYRND